MYAPSLSDFLRITPILKVLADSERLTPFETDAFISHREVGGTHVRNGAIPWAHTPGF